MDLEKKISPYLLQKGNIVKMVLLTALFAVIFINLFEPFNSRHWVPNISDFKYSLYSSLLILLGMGVVAISRTIMYKKISKKGKSLSYMQFFLWIAAEVCSMALVFVAFEKIILTNDTRSLFELYSVALRNTFLILFIPYSVLWLYFSWVDKNKKLKVIEEHVSPSAPETMQMVNFRNEKGDIRFSVKLYDLVYIRSADNYIVVYYIGSRKDVLSSKMIRKSMKDIEEELKPRGVLRCHRSFMVNSMHIKLLERTSNGLSVKLDTPKGESIPITKSYISDIYALFG